MKDFSILINNQFKDSKRHNFPENNNNNNNTGQILINILPYRDSGLNKYF